MRYLLCAETLPLDAIGFSPPLPMHDVLLPTAMALFRQVAAEVEARLHPLFPLPAVTEPHADDLLLQVQTLGHAQDLL